jgi:hypothetical protein
VKRQLLCLAAAALVVAIALISPMLWSSERGTLAIFAWVATWPVYPAFFIMMLTGPHRGPDGMPSYLDACVLAFVLWWLAIDFGPRLFESLGENERTSPPPT